MTEQRTSEQRACPKCRSSILWGADPKSGKDLLCLACRHEFDEAEAVGVSDAKADEDLGKLRFFYE